MYTLVINLGLRSLRGIIFNKKGEKIKQDWLPVRTSIKGDYVEQDPEEWWLLVQRIIKKLISDTKHDSKIEYISITSPSSCLVIIDKQGKPIYPALMVSDKRSKVEAAEIRGMESVSTIFDNDNFLAEASFLWPKISWMKNNAPEIMNKAAAFMNANDFLVYKLTGQLVTDPMNAEKLYYNPIDKCYPQALCDYIGIKQDSLPEVRPIGSDLGPITHQVASNIGLKSLPHIILATYDAICAFWGSGVSKEGEATSVSGTSLSFRVLSKSPAKKNLNGILSQYYQPQNSYIVGGSNNLEGGLVEWAKECFYGDSYYDRGQYLYSLMQEEAKESPIGARGLIFLPYLIGERVPHWDSYARGIMFGLERFHRRTDIMKSVFESMGYMTLSITNAIEKANVKIDNIRMSGGLSRLPYACEIRAHIIGKPIHVLQEHETAALGAFMIVAKSSGLITNLSELSNLAKIKNTYQFNPELHEKYNGLFEIFEDLYIDVKQMYKRRANMIENLNLQEEQTIENL